MDYSLIEDVILIPNTFCRLYSLNANANANVTQTDQNK